MTQIALISQITADLFSVGADACANPDRADFIKRILRCIVADPLSITLIKRKPRRALANIQAPMQSKHPDAMRAKRTPTFRENDHFIGQSVKVTQ
jgi:hypothetical protein